MRQQTCVIQRIKIFIVKKIEIQSKIGNRVRIRNQS